MLKTEQALSWAPRLPPILWLRCGCCCPRGPQGDRRCHWGMCEGGGAGGAGVLACCEDDVCQHRVRWEEGEAGNPSQACRQVLREPFTTAASWVIWKRNICPSELRPTWGQPGQCLQSRIALLPENPNHSDPAPSQRVLAGACRRPPPGEPGPSPGSLRLSHRNDQIVFSRLEWEVVRKSGVQPFLCPFSR